MKMNTSSGASLPRSSAATLRETTRSVAFSMRALAVTFIGTAVKPGCFARSYISSRSRPARANRASACGFWIQPSTADSAAPSFSSTMSNCGPVQLFSTVFQP